MLNQVLIQDRTVPLVQADLGSTLPAKVRDLHFTACGLILYITFFFCTFLARKKIWCNVFDSVDKTGRKRQNTLAITLFCTAFFLESLAEYVISRLKQNNLL